MLAYAHTVAAGLIKTGPCALFSVALAGADDAATCTVWDNTAGSGAEVVKLRAAAGVTVCWQPARAVAVGKGIYGD